MYLTINILEMYHTINIYILNRNYKIHIQSILGIIKQLLKNLKLNYN